MKLFSHYTNKEQNEMYLKELKSMDVSTFTQEHLKEHLELISYLEKQNENE
jgi:hypothetical protein